VNFQLDNFQNVILFLKNKSKVFKKTSSGWYQMFCPFCGDATRKANPTHGHLYISNSFPYFLCFRCNQNGNLLKLLTLLNFNDTNTISQIKQYSISNVNYIYNKQLIIDSEKNINDYIYLLNQNFIDKYGIELFKSFLFYLDLKSIDIQHYKYLLVPKMSNNQLMCCSYNYDCQISSTRIINNNQLRYINNKEIVPYYFQTSFNNIIEYSNIVLCEGCFDLINLHRFVFKRDDYFYLSMGSSFYEKYLYWLINNYLLIGNYILHIIIDKNYSNKLKLKNFKLPPNITIRLYTTITKDVSDCTLLKELKHDGR